MIEPISFNYCINFKGQENNNFKGITSSLPEANASLSARDTYNRAVNTADKIQQDFTAPAGIGQNLNIVG